MQSKAATVQQYLAELPADRRAAVSAVRDVIRKNLDKEYEEGIQYGMIGYYVPHSRYPDGYHCDPKQPLPFAGIASQKNAVSIYLMGTYMLPGEDAWLRAAWEKTGKKLDMGKSCIRFKNVEDVPLAVVGEAIKRMPAKLYIAQYEANKAGGAKAKATSKTAVKKATAAKTVAAKATAAKQVAAKATAAKQVGAKATAAKQVGAKATAAKQVAAKATGKKVAKKRVKKVAKRAARG